MPDPSDSKALRDAFGTFMTGVTVVTSHDGHGRPIGFTANSFTSVSLDPPLLLVCLARTSSNLEAFRQARGLAVNVLAEHQKDIANTFARPVAERFANIQWHPGPHGAPVIAEAAAWFDCELESVIDAGDHVILLARIKAFEGSAANGLGYVRGSYFSPRLAEEATLTAGAEARIPATAIATRAEEVLLFEDDAGQLALPEFMLAPGADGMPLAERLGSATQLPVVVGFVYAVCAEGADRRIVYRCELGDGVCKRGQFFAPDQIPLERVADPQSRDILRQFIAEVARAPFEARKAG